MTASQGVYTVKELVKLAKEDRIKVKKLGCPASFALGIHRAMLERPLARAKWLGEKTGLSPGTATIALPI